ncbi:hypothetical protein ACTID9_28715 (plasmid) [Brevibacillus fluminis]|uniref:hypothetical protein n=1 Tax=Brevibacillus fluminis TaxID=511487 RepID=UPI003F8AB4C7
MALLLFLAVLLVPSLSFAATVKPPVLVEADWITGGFIVKYDQAIPGATLRLYLSTDYKTYSVIRTWTADATSGITEINGLDNGDTIYYYVTQELDGVESARSNIQKQTPPYTVFVINWPDMLNDLQNMMQNFFTPSQAAIDGLKDALNNLADKMGAGAAGAAGSQIGGAIGDAASNMPPPIVPSPGSNPYGGGDTGGQLPNKGADIGKGKLPDLMSGTDTDLTFVVPITQGVTVKLFTKEQMEKFGWIAIIRIVVNAIIWIMFGLYLINRFTPHLKA